MHARATIQKPGKILRVVSHVVEVWCGVVQMRLPDEQCDIGNVECS